MNIKCALAVATLLTLPFAQQVHADVMGSVDGRSADLSTQADLSVEVNANQFAKEFDWQGLRVNYKVNDGLVVFADAAKLNASDVPIDTITANFEGQSFGGGFIYNVPELLSGYSTAVIASYHSGKMPDKEDLTLGGQPTTFDLEVSAMTARLLISPEQPALDNGLNWYASLGYSKIEGGLKTRGADFEFEDLTGFAGGVGIVMPFSFGEGFLGFESHDGENLMGGGIRYAF